MVHSVRGTLAAIAATARQAYGPGDHMVVRSSGIIHAVTMTQWLGDERLPGPACMVGISGWDPNATSPHTGPVTCGRCLRLHAPELAADADQLELFPTPPAAPRPTEHP